MNGLNAEPGWRCPLVARLNGFSRKLSPPTSALTSPVAFSIVTSEADGPTPLICATADSAAAWSSGSSVVLISMPPPNTRSAPNLSTACWVTQVVK